MSLNTFGLLAGLLGLALAGCSQSPAPSPTGASAAPPAAGAAASSAITLPIPAGQDVVTSVPLPPGTHKVGLATGPGGFSCTTIKILKQSGGESNNYVDADVPAKLNMTDAITAGSTPAGDTYVRVNVQCRGGAADTQLVIRPAP